MFSQLRIFVLALALFFGASLSAHHPGHGHGLSASQLAEYYSQILKSLGALKEQSTSVTEAPFVYYGAQKEHLNSGALADVFYHSTLLFLTSSQAESGTACRSHGCQHEKELSRSWARRLVDYARHTGIEITADAYGYYRQHGVSFAVFFFLFESFEHFVLDAAIPPLYSVPMCPIGLSVYAATVGVWKEMWRQSQVSLGRESLLSRGWRAVCFSYHRWRFARRTRWLFDGAKPNSPAGLVKTADRIEQELKKNCMWSHIRSALQTIQASQVNGGSAARVSQGWEADTRQLLLGGATGEAWEAAMQQVDGWNALHLILSLWLREVFEEGALKLGDYYRKRAALGDLSRLLAQYQRFLLAVAHHPGPHPESVRTELEEWYATLTQAFKDASALTNADASPHDFADFLAREELVHHQNTRRIARCIRQLLSRSH